MPKSPYDLYKTNKAAEQDGVDLDFGDFKIRIARAGGANRKYSRILEQKMRPYQTAIKAGTLDENTAMRIMAESYAEGIVLGWEGVTDETGKPMEFTTDNVVKLFTDLPDLFQEVKEQSMTLANFQAADAKAVAEELGNA